MAGARRRVLVYLLIAGGALVVLIAAIALIYRSASPPLVGSAAPTATIEPGPTATPAALTPEPVLNEAFGTWMDFLRHREGKADGFTALLLPVINDLSNGEITSAASAAERLERHVQDEIDWLTTNPPATCFADVHRDTVRYLKAAAQMNALLIPWFEAYPNGSQSDGIKGVRWAETASRYLDAATDGLELVDCGGLYLE